MLNQLLMADEPEPDVDADEQVLFVKKSHEELEEFTAEQLEQYFNQCAKEHSLTLPSASELTLTNDKIARMLLMLNQELDDYRSSRTESQLELQVQRVTQNMSVVTAYAELLRSEHYTQRRAHAMRLHFSFRQEQMRRIGMSPDELHSMTMHHTSCVQKWTHTENLVHDHKVKQLLRSLRNDLRD